ncbi:solute carrier family 22 member 13 [Drosophila albomicans]|uniref:Solute carrier family 22 member 13 n=1 Tax=Drosophila albomicans TaxID=7291 RepID=A0A6P8XZW1_DROAB|nr:solute carrier family 22 member 13 [Drosophila albomicans]XP_034116836.1 solute carrier family 22 member 13 [Drosophila albomicans]XP_051863305.1 solute carrier family 22 member 13 [Drosophila albomicans]
MVNQASAIQRCGRSPTPSPQLSHRNVVQSSQPSANSNRTDSIRRSTPAPLVTSCAAAPCSDIIGDVVGNFGIWQLRTILIIFLCKIPAAWFMACIIFTGPELYPGTEFTCDTSHLNSSSNYSVSDDQCYILDESSNISSECQQFEYMSSFDSLIMQFNLVCLRDIFVAWTQYWHLFGVLVGGVVGTKMMGGISPRVTYCVGAIAQILCGVVTGYARDFTLHCAFRCLSAVCCAIMFTAGQAIFSDITAGIHRVGAIILYDTFWSVGVILLPTLSSFFNSWSLIYVGITFPTIMLIVLLYWTPDSPRWLLRNAADRYAIDSVEQMVREGAEINDRTFKIPPDFRQQLEQLSEKLKTQPAPAPWTQLWQGKRAKTHMVAAHLALAFFVINFMGMLLNIRSFGRDYLVPNTIAMGFSEIIGCFLALHFALKHSKWKWQWAGSFNILAGMLGCLGWLFTGADTMDADLKVSLWMIIATIPKAGVSCAQSMLLACMNELVPANKKQLFVFSVVTWARVWLLSAPFFNVLKKIDTALSLTSYCVFSILGGICTCLLLTPRTSSAPVVVPQLEQQDKKEQSPLHTPVWTIESDVNNTRL